MGKTARFFKALFGFKPSEPDQTKRSRWIFFKSHPHKHVSDPSITRPLHHHHYSDQKPGDDHALAVATEVIPIRNRTTVVGEDNALSGEWAVVKIQAYFRGYLARKALRALKSLVMLQALVRGQIVRKETADNLRRLQALVRAQARIRARFQITESPQSITKGPPTPEKFEPVRSRILKHSQSSILKNYGSRLYDERSEKFHEIDSTRHHTRRRSLFQPEQISYSQSQSLTTSLGSTIHLPGHSPSGSYEATSLTAPFNCFPHDVEEHVSFYTVQNSPPFYATSKTGPMRVGPFTPAKSDSSRSCLSGYSDHPNYMAYTESSRAKVRSLSAPRQRPNFETPSTTKRYSVYGYGSGTQRGSNLRDSFVSKAYPGSGRLDRLGMPVGIGFRESEFSGGYWN
ncbi:hypothetical protein QVD17_01987 [Tagetes erecta]|uniref:DUF4005 domain-containing protein n=1 Tax=Tagetes erecta TaxID=13708 RepID=A0AAD8L8I7_TARER|nr:hypothetical protein QVD17_01987 [Tagetes erecta]